MALNSSTSTLGVARDSVSFSGCFYRTIMTSNDGKLQSCWQLTTIVGGKEEKNKKLVCPSCRIIALENSTQNIRRGIEVVTAWTLFDIPRVTSLALHQINREVYSRQRMDSNRVGKISNFSQCNNWFEQIYFNSTKWRLIRTNLISECLINDSFQRIKSKTVQLSNRWAKEIKYRLIKDWA